MHVSTLDHHPRFGYIRIGMILAGFSWKPLYPCSPYAAAKLYAYWINYHVDRRGMLPSMEWALQTGQRSGGRFDRRPGLLLLKEWGLG
jgi:hypothetical protein